MQTIRTIAKIDTTNKMTIAFDVSKDKLNYYSEVEGKITGNNFRDQFVIQDEVPNTPLGIIETLEELTGFAKSKGYLGIHVVCEPTGNYSDLLLKTAHGKGHTTAYVSGESVHKAKVIENHDSGKDDIKDPRVIFMLSKMGKELIFRLLPYEYKGLRELNRMYDTASSARIALRCRIQSQLIRLFCDFPMGKDFIFNNSGKVLFEEYGFSPWKIIEDSFEVFRSRMKNRCKYIHQKTLEELYKASMRSVLHVVPLLEQEIMEQSFKYEYEDYIRYDTRRNHLKSQTVEIYWSLTEKEEMIPIADDKVMKPFYLGRILGETGPLSDFKNIDVLNKYGGLNLRKCESGKYKGKLRMSKKGRAPLRGILGVMAFQMVKRGDIFGEYYHSRKENEKLPGTKLLAIIERKLLKIIFGMAKKKESYNSGKFMKCESQYNIAA